MLESNLGGLKLASPLLNASGCFNPETFDRLFPLNEALGAIVSKTVTPQAQPGNAQQRTVELPGVGMLNSIGLQGKGLAHFLSEDLPAWQGYGLPVILSLSAPSPEVFAEMVQAALSSPAAQTIGLIELNLSCPNVKAGGVHFGSSPQWVKEVVEAVKPVCVDSNQNPVPLLVKLTPNVSDIVAIAAAALDGPEGQNADGVTAINTVVGTHIDVRRRKLSLSKGFGGYSGPGIKPIALHAVVQLRRAFPHKAILGVGGISTATDVLEFLMAGASAVQLGTACFANPAVFCQVRDELTAFLQTEGLTDLSHLIGCAVD